MVEPVASEPRLFVGQIANDISEDQLRELFLPFGQIRNLHILKGSDGKPRGCAMVLFSRWSEAERAMEALDGSQNGFGGPQAGTSRPLVVHFANPRRSAPGQPQEHGIAARKLFIGQVPREATEESLRPLFEDCGEIEHINILRTQRGQSAGCAFVQFRRWCQAEAAIEKHNGKTRLGGSDAPLVVKFADAKRKENVMAQGNLRRDDWPGGGFIGLSPEDQQLMALQAAAQWQGNPGNLALQQQLAAIANLVHSGIPTNGPMLDRGFTNLQDHDPRMMLGGFSAANLPNHLLGSMLNVTNAQMHEPGHGGLGLPANRQLLDYAQAQQALQTSLLSNMTRMGSNMAEPAGITESPRTSESPSKPWGQRVASTDKFNEWKLFIGQVPVEATEQDLFSVFSPIGEILELYVLRNSNGKSRGCAFVTYANKYRAQDAISQLNGKQVPPGKTLVVKFADRATASNLSAPAAAAPSDAFFHR